MANQLLLTSGGISLMRDFLGSPTADLSPGPPLYIAFASGTPPVTHFLTSLQGETYRTQIVRREITDRSVTYYGFLGATDNNHLISAYGIIAGRNASFVPGGAGTLIACANEASPTYKGADETRTVQLTITVSGTIS
mgnify:CR=1 FL=1